MIKPWMFTPLAAVPIVVGSDVTDRASQMAASYNTTITYNTPANANGTITTVELWPYASNLIAVKVGTFYGSGTSWTNRAYASIGNVTYGSKQTFSGLSIAVNTNDVIGYYNTGGYLEATTSGGSGLGQYSGDAFTGGAKTYNNSMTGYIISLRGTG